MLVVIDKGMIVIALEFIGLFLACTAVVAVMKPWSVE
jgi:hypothetical protein